MIVNAMTLAELKRTLSEANPPAGLTPALVALWWARNDTWDKAHKLVMDEGGKDCAWVHAHLHRVEGDQENAGYWYRQAGRSVVSGSLPDEWEAITKAMLADEH
jgi:hypothetical protein